MNAISYPRPTWQTVGLDISEARTTSEALEIAGLNWETREAQLKVGDAVVHSHKAIVRTDNDEVLGVVGERYSAIENADAFSLLDGALDLLGDEFRFVSAGVVAGGRRVWVIADLGGFDARQGDEIRKQVLLTNSFDGSTPLALSLLPFRMFCANQIAMATRSFSAFKVRHLGAVSDRVSTGAYATLKAIEAFAELGELYQRMAERPLQEQVMIDVLDTLYPLVEQGSEVSERKRASRVAKRDEITRLTYEGLGQQGDPTLWSLYNGVTEYYSHHASAEGQAFARTAFTTGRDAARVAKATEIIEASA